MDIVRFTLSPKIPAKIPSVALATTGAGSCGDLTARDSICLGNVRVSQQELM